MSSNQIIKLDLSRQKLLVKPGDPLPNFYPVPKAIMVTPIYDDRDLGAPIPADYTRPVSTFYSESDSGSYRGRPYSRAVYTDSEFQDDRTERGSRYSSPRRGRSRSPSEESFRGRRRYTHVSYPETSDGDEDRYNRHSYYYSGHEPYRDASGPRHAADQESYRYSVYPSRPSSYAPPVTPTSPGAYYGRSSQLYSPFLPPSSHAGGSQAGPSKHQGGMPFVPSRVASRPPTSIGSWEHINSSASSAGRSVAGDRDLDDVFNEIMRLIPVNPHFCFSHCTGRKKAVCVGINYTGQKDALKGCGNDARAMRKYLMESHNFKSQNIILLTDDELGGATAKPTRREMMKAMSWLVDGAKMHDSLFFHYSGHGGQIDDETGKEADGKDEVIFPMDFKEAGEIVDDELFKTLVEPLSPGVRLTAVFDACHSGTVLDLPYLHSSHGRLRSIAHISRRMRMRGRAPSADVISFSACKDDETSADTFHGGVAVGAMSYALISTLKENPKQTYGNLLRHLRDILIPKYDQKAQISGTHPLDLDRQFVL